MRRRSWGLCCRYRPARHRRGHSWGRRQSPAGICRCFSSALRGAAVPELAAFQIQAVGFRDSWCQRCPTLLRRRLQVDAQSVLKGHAQCRLAPRDVGQLAVVLRSPEFAAVGGIDQVGGMLSSSPCWVMRPTSTAATCSVWPIWRGSSCFSLEIENGAAGHHFEVGQLRECADQALGEAVAEVVIARIRVALTNGSTAMESDLLRVRLGAKQVRRQPQPR